MTEDYVIATTCDRCGHRFRKYEWKALMKNLRVLCKTCYDKEKAKS